MWGLLRLAPIMHVVEPLAATIGIQCGLYKRGGHISGFPPYCNTVRTKVSGCYREGGCSSGVVIEKGSIHYIIHINVAYVFRQN